jgi:3-phosphoshikimate 1-carboxyvinyltransferase
MVVEPGRLSGKVEIPSSKSYAHRLLIAAALADGPTFVGLNATNQDIAATARCLEALGAGVEFTGDGINVAPIGAPPEKAALFCGESGSTLRFMIPLAAALGVECTFTGAGRLPERPNAPLTDALRAHGMAVSRDLLPMTISGRLTGGEYSIAGNISSQYITGLLMALPLVKGDSRIRLTTRLESAPYVDITLDVLKDFGVEVRKEDGGYVIPGGQRYASPGRIAAEGDWSGAAFWALAASLGNDVKYTGLNPASAQGDRAIEEMLRRLGSEIDVSETPDLVPALAVAAAWRRGVTRITGAARLRIKESDRLRAVSDMLRSLGCGCEELDDGLVITGGRGFSGGKVDGCNDHRIVMAAAVATTVADGPVTITDSQAVNKSYPGFFDELIRLGGIAHV